MEKYLGFGTIRGIGQVYARKLLRALGKRVFDVIEEEPARLRQVDGIGPVRARRITEAWTEQKVAREIMVFLHSQGVGTARATRVFKTYGADAAQVMTESPYRLTRDIRGIGFKTADAVAMRLGIEEAAMNRVRAGIDYVLSEAMDDGHCGLPAGEPAPLAAELLEAPQELVRTARDLQLAACMVVAATVAGTPCPFLAGLYRAERLIAERLSRIAEGRPPWRDSEMLLPWVGQRTCLSLAESQAEVVRLALAPEVMVVTGRPEVGKTTLMNAILRILAVKDVNILLRAPTGRAAKRLSEATGLEARTIHRLLEADPRRGIFRRAGNNMGRPDARSNQEE